jgi:hypothetical protein
VVLQATLTKYVVDVVSPLSGQVASGFAVNDVITASLDLVGPAFAGGAGAAGAAGAAPEPDPVPDDFAGAPACGWGAGCAAVAVGVGVGVGEAVGVERDAVGWLTDAAATWDAGVLLSRRAEKMPARTSTTTIAPAMIRTSGRR